MLSGNETPFPNNPVCKLCLTRPCKRLFSGRVYPGKMIFVHNSDFVSLPCHTPNLKPQEEAAEEAAALTDDIEVITGKVEITNPRWEAVSEAAEGGDPEVPLMGDKVRLLADVKNYPEGAPVSFDIYDVTESTPLRITTVKGTNTAGKASAEWTVADPQKRGESLKLSFEAGAKSKYTQKTDLPWQDKIRCDFVEFPDVLFHDNSAVPCLDEEGVLLGALTAAYTFSKDNTDKEIVFFGHTAASGDGDPAFNYDLSQWRAEGIKALIDNDVEAWLDIIDFASKVEDYQTILKTLAASHGWNCDPGTVDNADGPKTTAAVKAFQKEYNSRNAGSLETDGIIGPETWKALFAAVRSIVESTVKQETGKEQLPALVYGYNSEGIYACGESFPIDDAEKDSYKSATDQRVEMVFFDTGKAPELKEPADKTKVEKSEAKVYDPGRVERNVIEISTAITETDMKSKTVLEVEDVLFNFNSAVMMPDIPAGTTSRQGINESEGIGVYSLQKKTAGLRVLRAIYRFIEQFPDKKLVVVGHTDTSGDIKPNFELSDLRANNVLNLIIGDGDAWADVCYKKHQVEDYQQILKHYSQLLLWPCDPGKVDNKMGPLTRKAVTSFQELYNSNREQMCLSGGEIPVQEPSGDTLNKETWRAIFDLYRWETSIITLGDQDPEALNEFIDKITFVDENKKALGCGESFPIDKAEKKNYKSQKNRRVELLFFDEDEAPESIDCPEPGNTNYTETDVPFYDKKRFTNDYIEIKAPAFITTLDIQSVDSLGHPIPNASLTVTSDNKDIETPYSKDVTTDSDAYIRLFGVPVGTIEIKDKDGNILNMLIEGKEVAASIDAREVMSGITCVIVQEVAEELKEKYKKQRTTYSPVPTDGSTTFSPAGPRESKVQELFNVGKNSRFVAVDNLLMAAGLNSKNQEDVVKLVAKTLNTWLGDYYPVAIKRDYIVYHFYSVDSAFKIGVYNSGGTLLGTYDIVYSLVALLGAYSIFESVKEGIFVDMANHKYKIVVDKSDQIYDLETLVAENQQEEFSRLVRGNLSKVQISYYCRSVAQLFSVSLAGGTGYLETYGESSGDLNKHIHERNVAVVATHSLMYKIYINDYVKKVKECADEDKLRKLGPPIRGYWYPTPVSATDDQKMDLYNANTTSSAEYHAWLAIAEQINKFTGRRAEGFYFLAKYSYAQKISHFNKVQFEYNFTLDADGKTLRESDVKLLTGFETDIDTKVKNKLTNKKVVAGIEHEVSLITGDSKVTGKLKIGKYGFELANDGSVKCSNGPISTEVNPEEKTFGTGVELEAGENQKVYFGIHFQGLREDTVMAFVSNAPGFFERRSHKELLAEKTKWNDLDYAEQNKLEQLGFTMDFWDDKHNHPLKDFPASASKKYSELDATEKVAVVYLGFNSTTWPSLIKETAKKSSKTEETPSVT